MAFLARRSLVQLSFTLLALGVVSGLALILGAVGLYGVLSYVVAERTREIGVRMALGATAATVRRMVVTQGARVVLVGVTIGIVAAIAAIRRALGPHAAGIRAAFVYGSLAKGTDRAASDIDLMVISDSLRYADLYEAFQPLEKVLGRTLNPTLLTVADWKRKRAQRDSFVARIASQARLLVIGAADDLE